MFQFLLSLIFLMSPFENNSHFFNENSDPVQIAVAGLTHGHVHWIFGRDDIGDIEIVGIYESNEEVWQQYKEWYDLDDGLFSYFAAVVRGDIIVQDTDLSSLANNITVMKILDAARKSAETGKTIYLE